MSDFLDKLEKASTESRIDLWKGTFRDFLRLFETNKHGLGATSHQRVEQMILSAGTEHSDFFNHKRIRYKFFENDLFGIEQVIDSVMAYIHAAARKTETSRRMLVLYGPPSSGKSVLASLIKKGLEKFSRSDAGAVFAIEGSKMHENPFLLVPEHLRDEFEKLYQVSIEGSLSPHSQWRLDNEFHGRFMEFPVERIYLSEAGRVGIGTFLPGDSKVQEQTELTGSIDFAKIQQFGNEADPRAFNFDGELNVANRGMMEFIEGLRADERLLRVLLTATQEKTIKAPRFGLIFVDALIALHTNETEFRQFISEKKYEAYHDRMVIVPVPYNLGMSDEVKIYRKLLSASDIKEVHIAPHSLEAAAIFAVLSRMEPPKDNDLSPIKKMKLYDGQHVKGMKPEQVHDMKRKNPREGMTGVSPRFIIDQINSAIAKAIEDDRNFITALDILRQLSQSVALRDTFKQEDKNRFKELIDLARQEFNELLKNDIQKAFFLSFDDEAKALCEKYLEQIEASLSGQKPRDPVSGEEIDVDENLMDAIESHVDVTSSGKEDFRNEILRYFGAAARKGKTVDYTQHASLREAIQKQLFAERQGVIRMTVSTRNPDTEALRRLNEVIDRMVEHQQYTAESANEMLKYATAHLFDKK